MPSVKKHLETRNPPYSPGWHGSVRSYHCCPIAYLSSVIGVALKPFFDHIHSIDAISDIWKVAEVPLSLQSYRFRVAPTEGAIGHAINGGVMQLPGQASEN